MEPSPTQVRPPAEPPHLLELRGKISQHQQPESGVDEVDFVKTDGYHIYYLQGEHLHIFGVPEFGELEATANIRSPVIQWP